MKPGIKKLIFLIVTMFAVFWSMRIVSINQEKKTVIYHDMYEKIKYDSVTVTGTDFRIFSQKEYEDFFNVKPELNNKDIMLICCQIEFENTSDTDLPWDLIFNTADNGFESLTWMSVVDPFLGRDINILKADTLEKGAKQKIWYITILDPKAFSKDTWVNIRNEKFAYVLSMEPVKEVILLE